MNEQMQLIECPWCFHAIETSSEEETFICPICNRVITEDDIEYAECKED